MIGTGAINNNPTFNWIKTLERGTIFAYSSNDTAPDGALICNGAEISRTTYKLLFNVIGTTYGAGNGTTTFNLPDFTDRVLQGSSTAGTILNAGLPNITGEFGRLTGYNGSDPGTFTGAFKTKGNLNLSNGGTASSTNARQADFDASRSSSIYGKSSTVQPPALTTRYYIKY